MKPIVFATLSAIVLGTGAAAAAVPDPTSAPGEMKMAISHAVSARASAPALAPEAQNTLVSYYCATCHDDEAKTGGLSLESFDANTIDQHPDIAELMIHKLRAGMMPPPQAKERPDAATIARFATALETKIDEAAARHPNPGWRPFERLNRSEYARAVRDLVGLDVDVTAFLPPDTISAGFDNVADVQTFSATLLEGYLRAASRIALLAVGDRESAAAEATFRVPPTESQVHHVDGAPFGTRGGISVVHTFPADGDYLFKLELKANPCGLLYGATSPHEQIDLSVDGARVALVDIDDKMTEAGTGLQMQTPTVRITAGPHRVSAAFVQKFQGRSSTSSPRSNGRWPTRRSASRTASRPSRTSRTSASSVPGR